MECPIMGTNATDWITDKAPEQHESRSIFPSRILTYRRVLNTFILL
jgi:hypothetical protein